MKINIRIRQSFRRENALKAFLEGRKLTEDEIFRETNPNRVF